MTTAVTARLDGQDDTVNRILTTVRPTLAKMEELAIIILTTITVHVCLVMKVCFWVKIGVKAIFQLYRGN